MKKFTMSFLIALLTITCAASAGVKAMEDAPEFTLTDTNGDTHSLSDFKGMFVVLEWLNHNCPFVVKHYRSGNMQELQKKWTGKGIVWLSINSTNPNHRDYKTPEEANALTASYDANPTAVLMDPDGTVGKAYGAATTPHMYVVNPEGKLVYAGAIDSISDANPKSIKRAMNYVDNALGKRDQYAGVEWADGISLSFTKAYGCSVKYAK